MACKICNDTGWVCDRHPDRPYAIFSERWDACDCAPGRACVCNKDPVRDGRHGAKILPVGERGPTIH
jgi:hypothetical protein